MLILVKKKKKRKLTLPIRINVVFFSVFVLFFALILNLGFLQIIDGPGLSKEITQTKQLIVEKPVPRGKIYDRYGNLIVDNEPKYAITYTRTQATTKKEMLQTAEKLAGIIAFDYSKISEKDMKNYWILKNPEQAVALITTDERKKVDKGELKNADTYKMQLERLPIDQVNAFTETDKKIMGIYNSFDKASALSPQVVKNTDVTLDELSIVSERLSDLPGVDTTIDWNRKYNYDKTLKTILGNVSTSQEGLPLENIDYYLSRGYDRNDRVGKSYLEKQYEDLLRGQKEKVINTTDKAGNLVGESQTISGNRGKDLMLTIDMAFQQKCEEIISNGLTKYKSGGNSALLDRAFVVVVNPKNGEILSMAGKQYVINEETLQPEIIDMASGAFTTSYAMGSSVKGATVLTGYSTGAIELGSEYMDEPLHFAATKEKSSYRNMGRVNDLTALRLSSNVYMFRTAMKIGGVNQYVPNGPLKINPEAFDIMRNHYAQFGLGVKTGIDLPNERLGTKGNERVGGLLLDLAIGQYDTYTPLQMAQYVSTIANGGYRIQPHILKEVHEPTTEEGTLGPLYYEYEPVILNHIENTDAEIERVQTGFRLVTTSGTASSYFARAGYEPAGKTGTAQAFYDGANKDEKNTPTINVTFVSYAPASNPEIAFSVVVPWAYQGKKGHQLNLEIAQQVYAAYENLKAERANQPIKEVNTVLPQNNGLEEELANDETATPTDILDDETEIPLEQ